MAAGLGRCTRSNWARRRESSAAPSSLITWPSWALTVIPGLRLSTGSW